MHALEFVSASGAAMFHLVNITQPAPPLYCHHHHNWQLAGYMLLQLPCFGPKREGAGRERTSDEMKRENRAKYAFELREKEVG